MASGQGGELWVGTVFKITITSCFSEERVPELEEFFLALSAHEGDGVAAWAPLGTEGTCLARPPQTQLLFAGWYKESLGLNGRVCSLRETEAKDPMTPMIPMMARLRSAQEPYVWPGCPGWLALP